MFDKIGLFLGLHYAKIRAKVYEWLRWWLAKEISLYKNQNMLQIWNILINNVSLTDFHGLEMEVLSTEVIKAAYLLFEVCIVFITFSIYCLVRL